MRRSQWRTPTWHYTCPHCNALLLSGEKKSFCCNNGKTIVPPLPPLPPNIQNLATNPNVRDARNVSAFSRRLNNLFAFTAIGATQGFFHFSSGLSSVAITGRTYHRIFDVADGSHSIHWYLYDENERHMRGDSFNVPREWVDTVKRDLDLWNPYVRVLAPL